MSETEPTIAQYEMLASIHKAGGQQRLNPKHPTAGACWRRGWITAKRRKEDGAGRILFDLTKRGERLAQQHREEQAAIAAAMIRGMIGARSEAAIR